MLAACNICLLKALINIEVQKYLFGISGLIDYSPGRLAHVGGILSTPALLAVGPVAKSNYGRFTRAVGGRIAAAHSALKIGVRGTFCARPMLFLYMVVLALKSFF